jgi:selenophosphate synthetase-related protein
LGVRRPHPFVRRLGIGVVFVFVFVRHPDPGGNVAAALRLGDDGVVVDFERAFLVVNFAGLLPDGLLKGRFVLGLRRLLIKSP